jgi:aryl-alcohol dehydrogenase-like predicted oxidoreductase
VIAGKLWWEFWPDQDAAGELDASLARTGVGRFDFIYSDPPPRALAMDDVVAAVGELVTSGRVRAWGIVNWPADQIALACQVASRLGVPGPCAAQLAYNIVARSPAEDPDMVEALASCGASVIASWVLAGGVLTGKYDRPGVSGRMDSQLDEPRVQPAVEAAARLRELARDAGTTPAALAIAFPLTRRNVACVLFGATSPEQVEENVRACGLLDTLTPARLEELERIGRPAGR